MTDTPMITVDGGEDGTIRLSGAITFESVGPLIDEARRVIHRDSVTLDLSQVSRADSAGVALLMEWLKLAQFRGTQLSFVNVPEQVVAIARAAHLESVLSETPS